jgi:hypothetical protein
VRAFQEQVDKLGRLQVDSAEYGCLKAIALFTPGELLGAGGTGRGAPCGTAGQSLVQAVRHLDLRCPQFQDTPPPYPPASSKVLCDEH